MIFYYFFLLLAPFQDHPKLGATLFDLGFIPITPIKIAGIFIVLAALIVPRPKNAAPRIGSAMPALYVAFALFPVFGTLLIGAGVPAASLAAMVSFAMLLIATRKLVVTPERLHMTIRVLFFAEAFGSLWLYKQYYLQHWIQPTGPSSDGNYEALTLVMVLPIALHLVRFDPSKLWRWLGIGAIPVMAYGVLVAQSRGGLLAMAAIALLGWSYSKRKLAALLVLAIGVVLLAAFGPKAMWERMAQIQVSGQAKTGAEVSTRTRIELWRGGIRMVESSPLYGVGLDNFKRLVGQYNPNLYSVINQNYIAHNTYIQLAAEGGLPTLALFLTVMFATLRKFRACERETDPRVAELVNLALSMRLGLYAYAVAAFFISAQFEKEFWLYVFLSPNLYEIIKGEVERVAKPALTVVKGALAPVTKTATSTTVADARYRAAHKKA